MSNVKPSPDSRTDGWSWWCGNFKGEDVTFYLEASYDRVTRSAYRYGNCWVYSGNPRSFCPRESLDGGDAYGELTAQPLSELIADLPFLQIKRPEFECAWAAAADHARPRVDSESQISEQADTVGEADLAELRALRDAVTGANQERVRSVIALYPQSVSFARLFLRYVMRGEFDFADAMIKGGFSVDTQVFGTPALVFAAAQGNLDAIRFLLDRGASPDIRAQIPPWTPVEIAALNGHAEAVEILRHYIVE